MEYVIILLYLFGFILMLLLSDAIKATPKKGKNLWVIFIFFTWWVLLLFGVLKGTFRKEKTE